MSYVISCNDIEELSAITWNYCILDEGHIIKNGKAKITKAIKTLNSNHRLILSGTPIQVNYGYSCRKTGIHVYFVEQRIGAVVLV